MTNRWRLRWSDHVDGMRETGKVAGIVVGNCLEKCQGNGRIMLIRVLGKWLV
jgi:predicted choloylglycine hydrolase